MFDVRVCFYPTEVNIEQNRQGNGTNLHMPPWGLSEQLLWSSWAFRPSFLSHFLAGYLYLGETPPEKFLSIVDRSKENPHCLSLSAAMGLPPQWNRFYRLPSTWWKTSQSMESLWQLYLAREPSLGPGKSY